MRKIVIDGKEWKWKVGKSNVVFFDPAGRKTYDSFLNVVLPSFTNSVDSKRSAFEYVERGIHKRYFHITPKMIESYLRSLTTRL